MPIWCSAESNSSPSLLWTRRCPSSKSGMLRAVEWVLPRASPPFFFEKFSYNSISFTFHYPLLLYVIDGIDGMMGWNKVLSCFVVVSIHSPALRGLAKKFLVPGWRVGWITLHDHGDSGGGGLWCLCWAVCLVQGIYYWVSYTPSHLPSNHFHYHFTPLESVFAELRPAIQALTTLIMGANSLVQVGCVSLVQVYYFIYHMGIMYNLYIICIQYHIIHVSCIYISSYTVLYIGDHT